MKPGIHLDPDRPAMPSINAATHYRDPERAKRAVDEFLALMERIAKDDDQ